jgi:hypothetical protein
MSRHRSARIIDSLTVVAVLTVLAPAVGCGGRVAGDKTGSGGGAGQTAGAGGGPVDANGNGTADASPDRNEASPPAAACSMTPLPQRTSGSTVTLELEPRLGGKTFVFGEPNAAPAGGTIVPLNFRFYVSHVALLRAAGDPVTVDLVTPTGAPEPYGVHFFNADDASSQRLRVLAPAGVYKGLTFTLGVDDGCNALSRSGLFAPLDDDSQMTWPHEVGYLFLRYEGRFTPGDAADAGAIGAIPPAIHMGGAPRRLFAPIVTAPGALTVVAGQATSRGLILDMEAIFEGATSDVEPSTLSPLASLPEVLAGERLRQHAPRLPLFVLGP